MPLMLHIWVIDEQQYSSMDWITINITLKKWIGCFLSGIQISRAKIVFPKGEQGWRSGESSPPPTNVVRVWFPDTASYVGWVCCLF